MADASESASDAQITFKVKTSQDGLHTITMLETATVLELKTKLSGGDYENVPVERQRLIYSGRVMKNDDTLATYKIKPNNTIHMVKSAASNPSQPASTSTPTPQAVPSNMASGTANNPLAGLTGARYAGHQINLPGMDMFGPDGGMGPPMDADRVQRMMSDPNVLSSINEALNNPDFINMVVDNNPMLRNVPNAREFLTSPFAREMMTNPQTMARMMRMHRYMHGGNAAFPAPGATDTTPDDAAAAAASANSGNGGNNDNTAGPNMMNFMPPFPMMDPAQMQQHLSDLGINPFAPQNAGQGAQQNTPGNQESAQRPPAANPFAALFPPSFMPQEGAPPSGGLGANDFQRMMQALMGGDSAAASAAQSQQPPEERYADQLRQLNDMGFCDFDRNVAALRRSGGSVQGAIEHLLSATD